MDLGSIIQLLGNAADDPPVQRFLTSHEIQTMPKLKRGDPKAYAEIPDDGIYLVFTDEGFFRKIRGSRVRCRKINSHKSYVILY